MFGQADARWPASTALVLMVAFFGVHLNSDLYLASPVTDDSPGDSNNLAELAQTEHPEHHNSTSPSNEASECLKEHKEDETDCLKKAAEHDFKEVKDMECAAKFAVYNCAVLTLCKHCNKGGSDLKLQMDGHDLDELLKDKCKKWESMAPKVPSTCIVGGQRSGGASDSSNTGLIIAIIVVIFLVVFAFIYYYFLSNKKRPHILKKKMNAVPTQSKDQQSIETLSDDNNRLELKPEPVKPTNEKTSQIERVTPTTGLSSMDTLPLSTAQSSLCTTKSTIQCPRPPRHQPNLTLNESTYSSTISSISSDPYGTTSIFMFTSSGPSPSGLDSNMKAENGQKESGEDKARAASVGAANSAMSTDSTGTVKVKSPKSLMGGKSTKSKKSAKSSKGGKSAKK